MTDTDTPITHEEAEQIITTAPTDLITRLPDSLETRAARRNLEVAADYIHQAIEKAPRP